MRNSVALLAIFLRRVEGGGGETRVIAITFYTEATKTFIESIGKTRNIGTPEQQNCGTLEQQKFLIWYKFLNHLSEEGGGGYPSNNCIVAGRL